MTSFTVFALRLCVLFTLQCTQLYLTRGIEYIDETVLPLEI